MIPRQSQMLQLIRQTGHCSVEGLARELNVSDMTVRRDLQTLESSGHVLRTHGGAALVERVAFEFGFMERATANRAAKRAIAAKAFEQLGRARSVLLDSGTTTLALAENLRTHSGLTVITTSLPIASALQFSEKVRLLLLGGLLRRESPDLTGALTESNLERLHADVAYIGADAVSRQGVAFNQSLDVARMLQKMAAAADRVYLLADSSKIGGRALARSVDVRKLSGLVTDSGITPSVKRTLEKAGVKVFVAPNQPETLEKQGA